MVQLTIATEDGVTFNVDVDLSIELENFMALLEAESSIPMSSQLLSFQGVELTDAKKTIESFGVKEEEVLLLRQKGGVPPPPAPAAQQGGSRMGGQGGDSDEAERMRQQVVSNPGLMAQIRQSNPQLAEAAVSNPAGFRQLYSALRAQQEAARREEERQAIMLNSDPYNIEAQRKIEETIRQQAVEENLETAMENMPEAFGSVHMLYVNTEVNGQAVKAFVDSGAQATIMSPDCAERCGIMRLIDRRYAGMARGVGTAKILGRVHSAQLKMGTDLYLQCSFTIMEGRDVELLFGLDMLKRHQACIDLSKDALVIQGREIRFLSEHELPKFGGNDEEFELDEQGNPRLPATSAAAAPAPAAGSSSSSSSNPASSSSSSSAPFPGTGHSLAPVPSSAPSTASAPPSKYPEEAILSLVNLGADRQHAVQLLDAAGGNPEIAANLLFNV